MLKCKRITPQFAVTDLERALLFWDSLGFEENFRNGNPTCFALVRNGEAEVHLKIDVARAGRGHGHILVESLDALSQCPEMTVLQQPRKQSWGLRDMVVADPDGNTLEIAETIPAASV